mmetsp:Transcript_21758/g.70055  ORF Transcript_21758/g.70055 Transcript_21758/m.70055 type:complete len:298 (-) Transcript_21758:16-909(-)
MLKVVHIALISDAIGELCDESERARLFFVCREVRAAFPWRVISRKRLPGFCRFDDVSKQSYCCGEVVACVLPALRLLQLKDGFSPFAPHGLSRAVGSALAEMTTLIIRDQDLPRSCGESAWDAIVEVIRHDRILVHYCKLVDAAANGIRYGRLDIAELVLAKLRDHPARTEPLKDTDLIDLIMRLREWPLDAFRQAVERLHAVVPLPEWLWLRDAVGRLMLGDRRQLAMQLEIIMKLFGKPAWWAQDIAHVADELATTHPEMDIGVEIVIDVYEARLSQREGDELVKYRELFECLEA